MYLSIPAFFQAIGYIMVKNCLCMCNMWHTYKNIVFISHCMRYIFKQNWMIVEATTHLYLLIFMLSLDKPGHRTRMCMSCCCSRQPCHMQTSVTDTAQALMWHSNRKWIFVEWSTINWNHIASNYRSTVTMVYMCCININMHNKYKLYAGWLSCSEQGISWLPGGVL